MYIFASLFKGIGGAYKSITIKGATKFFSEFSSQLTLRYACFCFIQVYYLM